MKTEKKKNKLMLAKQNIITLNSAQASKIIGGTHGPIIIGKKIISA